MALPLHDDTPTYRAPVVTYLLIAANVVVYLISPLSMLGRRAFESGEERLCAVQGFLAEYAAIPKELIGRAQLPLTDVIDPACTAYVEPFVKSPALSGLTMMFLHDISPLHLIFNMLALFVYGPAVEHRLGSLRFTLFYLLCGYAAAYGFALTYASSTMPLIGASGAIAGVTGAYIVLFPHARINVLLLIFPLRLPAWVILGAWLGGQWFAVFSGTDDQVAYWAHLYGFAVGALWGVALRRSRDHPATVVYGWR